MATGDTDWDIDIYVCGDSFISIFIVPNRGLDNKITILIIIIIIIRIVFQAKSKGVSSSVYELVFVTHSVVVFLLASLLGKYVSNFSWYKTGKLPKNLI